MSEPSPPLLPSPKETAIRQWENPSPQCEGALSRDPLPGLPKENVVITHVVLDGVPGGVCGHGKGTNGRPNDGMLLGCRGYARPLEELEGRHEHFGGGVVQEAQLKKKTGCVGVCYKPERAHRLVRVTFCWGGPPTHPPPP